MLTFGYHSGLFIKSISTSSYLTPASNNAIRVLCAQGHDLLLYSLIGFGGSIDMIRKSLFFRIRSFSDVLSRLYELLLV